MLSRALMLALVAASASGCFGLAMGNAVPGSRPIYRAGGTWQDQGNGYEKYVAGDPHGLAGPLGFALAGRFGLGSVKLGDAPAVGDAGQLDIRFEVAYSLNARLGLAASGGWSLAGAHSGGTDVSRMGFPVGLVANIVPFTPFVVRAGGFVRPGYITIDELGGKQLGLGTEIGSGVLVQFIAWHFVAMVDWQREWIGEVMTPAGNQSYVSDFFLLDIIVVGW